MSPPDARVLGVAFVWTGPPGKASCETSGACCAPTICTSVSVTTNAIPGSFKRIDSIALLRFSFQTRTLSDGGLFKERSVEASCCQAPGFTLIFELLRCRLVKSESHEEGPSPWAETGGIREH